MKVRPIAIAVMTLSSAATFAFAATSDKSTAASNPSYSTSQTSLSASASSQSDNATITQLQQALNDKGYDAGTVDGQMGPKTRSALKKFQQAQGLQQSGQVDSQTVAALNLGSGPNASTEVNTSSQGSMPSQGTNGSAFSPQSPQPQSQSQSQQPQSQQQAPGSTPSS